MSKPKLKRAVVALTGRLQESPRDAAAALALAEALRRLARETPEAEERVKYLARACQLDPYDAVLRVELGRARLDAGDARGGLESLRAATVIAPGSRDAWLGLGHGILARLRASPKAKVADRAIEAFEKAAAIDPGCVAAHAGRIVAACHARVPSPERSRIPKVLPQALQAIPPAPELAGYASWLALASAHALQFRRSTKKLTAAERSARQKGFDAVLAGLAPWLAAFPEDRRIAAVPAAIGILRADDDGLADAIAGAAASLPGALLQAVASQRLEELEPARRVEVLNAVGARLPLANGLDRELLAAVNAAARSAVAAGKLEDAERLWRAGLATDPYNAGLHHNLALGALARRDGVALARHLESASDLYLAYWLLGAEPRGSLERLAARHESLAGRLKKAIDEALAAEGTNVEPGLIAAWVAESSAHVALRAVLLSRGDGALPERAAREELAAYVRSFRPFAGGSRVPPSIAALVDSAPSGTPPLHYDALDVPANAPPSMVQKRYGEASEQLKRTHAEAVARGEVEAARRTRELLEKLEAAYEVLADVGRRKRYDAECLPPAEHGYHMARRRLVHDLHEVAHTLMEKKAYDAVAHLAHGYHQVPHDKIDVYFEAVGEGRRALIRANMLAFQYRELLDEAQELMAAEKWPEARDLLRLAVLGDGGAMRFAHYLLGICEMRCESAHIREKGSPSAPGVRVAVGAKERLASLPAPPETPDDEKGRITLEEILAKVGAGVGSGLVLPGIGVGGVVVGQSTVEDVLRIYGADCSVNERDGEVFEVNYDYNADGSFKDLDGETPADRPTSFEFEGGVVSYIEIGSGQMGLRLRGGVGVESKEADVVAELGTGFARIRHESLGAETYRYPALGIDLTIRANGRVSRFGVFKREAGP